MFPYPSDEFERVDLLPAFGIDAIGPDAEFDSVVALAADLLSCPMAALFIMGDAKLTMVAGTGMTLESMSRDAAFCSHTIALDAPLVIPDLTLDDRFHDNALVTGGPKVRFYAGTQIMSREGIRLGTLCVMDRKAWLSVPGSLKILERLANIVSQRLDARRDALDLQRGLQDKLSESEQLCRTALNLASLVPWQADSRGRVTAIGQGWEELTGFPRTALLNFAWINHIHADDVEAFFARWREAVLTGAPFEADMRLTTVHGTWAWCRTRAMPARNAADRIMGWFGLIENIDSERRAETRLKTLQAELDQRSRLSAMETMASTLAHELNQPLAAITQYVRGSQRLLRQLDDSRTARIDAALEEAATSALRAGDIVRGVRELVSRGEVQRRREPVSNLIADSVRAVSGDVEPTDVEYRIEIASDVSTVLIDPVQIQQVLINLLRNAVQALRDMPKKVIVISAEQASNEQCAVTVSDNGPGLSSDVTDRLFMPFNTSKTDGMGIGLAISRTIIEAHDGQISASTIPGSGSAFQFTLPVG